MFIHQEESVLWKKLYAVYRIMQNYGLGKFFVLVGKSILIYQKKVKVILTQDQLPKRLFIWR